MPTLEELLKMLLMGEEGSQIAKHQAETPGLARSMRYDPTNARNQQMQDYLGPLAAQDFARDAVNKGDVGGMVASAGSPAYVAGKAVAPRTMDRMFGEGEALQSKPSMDQIARAYRGLIMGAKDRAGPQMGNPNYDQPPPSKLPKMANGPSMQQPVLNIQTLQKLLQNQQKPPMTGQWQPLPRPFGDDI
jgi:hypothetical protein